MATKKFTDYCNDFVIVITFDQANIKRTTLSGFSNNIFLMTYFFLNEETMTAIVVGSNNGYSITTFDWTTMQYHLQPVQYIGNRFRCGCGLLRNQNGQLLVATAGEI